jgi:hypothetical protein
MRDARQAGTNEAKTAAASSVDTLETNTGQSADFTPNSCVST